MVIENQQRLLLQRSMKQIIFAVACAEAAIGYPVNREVDGHVASNATSVQSSYF